MKLRRRISTAFPLSVGRLWRIGCLALLSLASACTGLPSATLTEPDLQLPVQWPGPGTPSEQDNGAAAPGLNWRSFYTDPDLRRLIQAALLHNRDLRLALLRVAEAKAANDIQFAERLPSVGLGGDFARGRVPGDLNVTGRSQIQSDREVTVGLNSWELDLWGRVRSLNTATLQNYLATAAGRRATQISVIQQVARHYVAARGLEARLALARKSMESRDESLRIFTRRVELGSASRYALAQARTLLHQARVVAVQLEQRRTLQLNALEQLTGMRAGEPRAQTELSGILGRLPEGLPSDLLVNRPDIVAAEYQLKAAQANVQAARAAFLPRIALVGRAGSASAQLNHLFDAGSDAWQFAPSITLPIFDGGALRANLALQAVRQNMAVAEYEKRIENALREVKDALANRSLLGQQQAALQDQFDSLRERRRLAQLRYDNGASPYLEVLDAEREMLSAEQQLYEARENHLLAQIDLFSALGGGTTPGFRAGSPSRRRNDSPSTAQVSP